MRIFSTFSVFVCLVFLAGCEESKQPISVVLEGQPETVTEIKDWLENNTDVTGPVLGQKYIVKVIPPKEGIDHKITIIQPASDVDFKIGIINPNGNKQTPQTRELEEKLADLIRKQLQEKTEKKP